MGHFDIWKIDKCKFCGRKAEYYFECRKFFTFTSGFACEKHKQEISDAISRKYWF